MTFISFAQNFEDVLLWRALGHLNEGRYLDIGAQDPVLDSVSLAFYKAGWRGTHVEATAMYAAKLREARPDETVIQAAVSDKPGPMVFYEIAGTGLSTGSKEVATSHLASGFENQTVVVPSVRLDELLEMENRDIHWMKIDVEGMEDAVLRSWGESAVRPWVLVIEATYPSSQKPTHLRWLGEVSRRGYKEVYFDGLSRFFVHERHQALARDFATPPNVFDRFSLSEDHFAIGEAKSQFNARVATAQEEARQSIDAARARVQAAESESAQLRSDLSEASDRLIQAHRSHRQSIMRIWEERRESEAALRRQARDAEDDRAREAEAIWANAQSDQRAHAQVYADTIAVLEAETRGLKLQLSESLGRERTMRRHHEEMAEHVREQAQVAAEVQAAVEEARQERDSFRAEVARLTAAESAAVLEREAAENEAERKADIAREIVPLLQSVLEGQVSAGQRLADEFSSPRLMQLLEALSGANGSLSTTRTQTSVINVHSS